MDIANDHRSFLRLPASGSEARLRWPETGRAGEVKGCVVDISLTGALIARGSGDRAAGFRLWLRMRGPGASEWVAGRVARDAGPGLVAVAFDRRCPPDLLWSATLGDGLGNLLTDAGASPKTACPATIR
jgi:hypothetical protein